MTLIDTNVLLDLFTNDLIWAEWSVDQIDRAGLRGPLLINEVVYAETSVGFTAIEGLDASLAEVGVTIAPSPRPALFIAGKVFKRYRAAGGPRQSILPDFFIGAHAAVSGAALLTRDPGRYRTYFPSVELVAPWCPPSG